MSYANDDRVTIARQRVAALRTFYTHVVVYLVINAGLLVLNVLSTPGSWWFFWPLFGWGIGLAAHALNVFGLGPWLGAEWEERQVRKILDQQE